MRVRVHVSSADILHGKPRECAECPVALGLIRALRKRHIAANSSNVSVSYDASIWVASEGYLIACLPQRALRFIADFDCHTQVRPMQFTLDFQPGGIR